MQAKRNRRKILGRGKRKGEKRYRRKGKKREKHKKKRKKEGDGREEQTERRYWRNKEHKWTIRY